MTERLTATHGTVCRLPEERHGYFGWPTVARLDDGRLLVASSGLRSGHICPWGKTVLNVSTDDGATWSAPRVINDSPIDDRDAGIIDLGRGHLLVTWFTSDTRRYAAEEWVQKGLGPDEALAWREELSGWTDALVEQHLGSWAMRSEDGGASWGAPFRVPVSAPHGPVRLRSGDLLYLGKLFGSEREKREGLISAAAGLDGGRRWEVLGSVPVASATEPVNYHEPHVLELPSGRLLGMIRIQNHSGRTLEAAGIPTFSLMQTESDDGGTTWTEARPLGFHGSPPHLLRHSSGVLVLTYGYRLSPFGQRVALSRDDGATWEHDWILRDDGPDGDLGYPATVELGDGSLLSVYYQKAAGDRQCSLLQSRWRLP